MKLVGDHVAPGGTEEEEEDSGSDYISVCSTCHNITFPHTEILFLHMTYGIYLKGIHRVPTNTTEVKGGTSNVKSKW